MCLHVGTSKTDVLSESTSAGHGCESWGRVSTLFSYRHVIRSSRHSDRAHNAWTMHARIQLKWICQVAHNQRVLLTDFVWAQAAAADELNAALAVIADIHVAMNLLTNLELNS